MGKEINSMIFDSMFDSNVIHQYGRSRGLNYFHARADINDLRKAHGDEKAFEMVMEDIEKFHFESKEVK